MDSKLTEIIDNNTDEHFIMVRTLVDHYIVVLSLGYTHPQRNEIILEVFKRLEKNYLANPNSKFDINKKVIIDVLVKSYLAKYINNSEKDL